MSKEEFGSADLISTIVGLLSPILTLSISQGVMRFALDKAKDTREVFTFGLKVTLYGSVVMVLSYPLLTRIPIIKDYILVFLLLYISQVLQSLTGLFARGLNKMKYVGMAGVISSFIVVGSNILLLFVFHYGVTGYLYSIVFSNIVFVIFLFVACRMYFYIGGDNNRTLNKEMLTYSLPIIPNSMSWWIQHSANRYILNFYCGVADVGLYSAASKMPTIVDTFRGIFVQAWQLSTITEYGNKESAKFFKNIYKLYNVFIVLLCSFMLVFCKVLAIVLYSDSFYEAWKFTPLLIVGILFSSLVAFYSPIYLAKKNTNKLFLSTALGAAITIVANFVLVPFVGSIGSAISVVISNFTIFLYLHIDTKKYLQFKIGNWRIFTSYILLLLQGVLITFYNCSPTGVVSLIIVFLIILLNLEEITSLISDFINKVIKKK